MNMEIIRLLLRGKMNFRQKFLLAALIFYVSAIGVAVAFAVAAVVAVARYVIANPYVVIR